jgi:PIN domain nuclease of toxin-antitoxin system
VYVDSSAVLLQYREHGHEQVAELLAGAVVSTVNWAEIVQRLAQRRHPAPVAAAEAVRSPGVNVLAFTADDAVRAAQLWRRRSTSSLTGSAIRSSCSSGPARLGTRRCSRI